jgi:cytidine deaminase
LTRAKADHVPDAQIVELIEAANGVQGALALRKNFSAGEVGAALRSASGRIYTGVCLDVACGIGFCAEHSAIAEMLKHRETQIHSIVAIDSDGILPPCGRCRELMAQLNAANAETVVVLDVDRTVPLKDLLPNYWLKP